MDWTTASSHRVSSNMRESELITNSCSPGQQTYLFNGKPKRASGKHVQAVLKRVGGKDKSYIGVGKLDYREDVGCLCVCSDRDKPVAGSVSYRKTMFIIYRLVSPRMPLRRAAIVARKSWDLLLATCTRIST